MITINERIFSLLLDRRLTQQHLADSIGVSFKTVSSWKQRGNNPPAESIPAIAELLGVSCSYLLTGNEESYEISDEALVVAREWMSLDAKSKAITKGDIFRRSEILQEEKTKLIGKKRAT